MKFSNVLSTNLYNYLISDNTFIEDIRKPFKIESYVSNCDLQGNIIPNSKRYGFIGNGCGITYLIFDKRSNKAKELNNIVREVRANVNEYLMTTFTSEEHKYFEDFGCPILAVLQQDQQIQIEFYSRVVDYAKKILGINKISYRSVLD